MDLSNGEGFCSSFASKHVLSTAKNIKKLTNFKPFSKKKHVPFSSQVARRSKSANPFFGFRLVEALGGLRAPFAA